MGPVAPHAEGVLFVRADPSAGTHIQRGDGFGAIEFGDGWDNVVQVGRFQRGEVTAKQSWLNAHAYLQVCHNVSIAQEDVKLIT